MVRIDVQKVMVTIINDLFYKLILFIGTNINVSRS